MEESEKKRKRPYIAQRQTEPERHRDRDMLT